MKKSMLFVLTLCVGGTVLAMVPNEEWSYRKSCFNPEFESVLKRKPKPRVDFDPEVVQKSESLWDSLFRKKSEEEFIKYKEEITEMASPDNIISLEKVDNIVIRVMRKTFAGRCYRHTVVMQPLRLTIKPRRIFFDSNAAKKIFFESLLEVFELAKEYKKKIDDELLYILVDCSGFKSCIKREEYISEICNFVERNFRKPDCVVVDGKKLSGISIVSLAHKFLNIPEPIKFNIKQKSKSSVKYEQSR
jgi:hypothetical protein